jgi:hypothetical protein
VHFYCINSDTNKCTFIYITLFHNTAIPDMFQRLSWRHHHRLYLGLHIKSMFCCRFEQYKHVHTIRRMGTPMSECGKIAQGKNIERCTCISYLRCSLKKIKIQLHPLAVSTLYHLHRNITLVKSLPCMYILYYKNDVHLSLKIFVAIIGVCIRNQHTIIVCTCLYCSNLQWNMWILCEDLGVTPDDGIVIGAETCWV